MEHTNQNHASAKTVSLCQKQGNSRAVWDQLRVDAAQMAAAEPQLEKMLEDVVLSRGSLAESLSARLARKLSREDMQRGELEPLLTDVLGGNQRIVDSASRDMQAIVDRDPACQSALEPLLFFKGFLAITSYRMSHQLWHDGRKLLALYFQSLGSEVFGVDIHPAARIGCGILLDHATSVVIGETSIVEDDVSILHEVTLGGTGKQTGNRHPIVRSGVLIGAGSKILGRVTIGECAKIGAGSVVLEDVPPHQTVAGVPAVIVGESSEENPALDMNQQIGGGI
ncbi:MAG: serine O-acetyltransferase [Akkermansiaceae bacterium]